MSTIYGIQDTGAADSQLGMQVPATPDLVPFWESTSDIVLAASTPLESISFKGGPNWTSANNTFDVFLLAVSGNARNTVAHGVISEPADGQAQGEKIYTAALSNQVIPAGTYRLAVGGTAGTGFFVNCETGPSGCKQRLYYDRATNAWSGLPGYAGDEPTQQMILYATFGDPVGGGTAPTLSSVSDTTPSIGAQITLTSANNSFAASGNVVMFGATQQSIVSESAGSIVATFNPGTVKLGGSADITVTVGALTSSGIACTVQPPAGWVTSWVDLVAPLVPVGQRPSGSPDVQAGGQFAWSNSAVTAYADGHWSANTAPQATQALYWDPVGGYQAQFSLTITDATAPADTTAPIISGATAGTVTSSGCQPAATVNEAGTLTYALYAQGATPTAAQVEVGTGALSAAVSSPVAAGVAHQFPAITGQPASTPRRLAFVARDTAGNLSTSPTYVDFSTAVAPAGPDTVAPVVYAPAPLTISLPPGSVSVSRTESVVQAWLSLWSANDAVVGNLAVSNDCPATLLVSASPITVTGTASDGTNTGSATSQIVLQVALEAAPGVSPDAGIYEASAYQWERVGSASNALDMKSKDSGTL